MNGILLSYTGATSTVIIANNLIGDLKAPITNNDVSDVVRGISITSTTTTANFNIYFNTIFINASSSGTHFGTSGIFHTSNSTATTATLDLRNNIIINTSTAAGLGSTAALRRSGGGVDNYATTSNNNLFFAGTPSATNAIYNDGSAYQTLATFIAAVSPRETNSKTENVVFTSTVGSSMGYLHVNAAIASLANANATVIAGIVDDFDGQTRNASTPDIGADEFTPILPLTLVSFTGNKNAEGNILSWQTAKEVNNLGFELMRSADGKNYSKITFIGGTNNTNSSYSFIDKNPLASNNYYILKQIDKDGKTTLSNVVVLKGNKINKLELSAIYPNPVNSELRLLINNSKSISGSISIVDFTGKVLLNQTVQLVNGETNIRLNVASLQKGNYVVRIATGEETVVSKFMKQ